MKIKDVELTLRSGQVLKQRDDGSYIWLAEVDGESVIMRAVTLTVAVSALDSASNSNLEKHERELPGVFQKLLTATRSCP